MNTPGVLTDPTELPVGKAKAKPIIDSGNFTLVAKPGSYAVTGTDAEAAIIGRVVIQPVAPADVWRSRVEEKLDRALAAKRPPKPRRRKPKRRQAKKWVQDEIIAKLKAKFPPDGKAAKKLRTVDVCRQLGLDPKQYWHSVNRAIGREP